MASAQQLMPLMVVRLDKCKMLFTRGEYALLLNGLQVCHEVVVDSRKSRSTSGSVSGSSDSLEKKIAGTTCAHLYERLTAKCTVDDYAKKEFSVKLFYSELLAIYVYLTSMKTGNGKAGDYEYVTYLSLIGKIFKACSDNKLL